MRRRYALQRDANEPEIIKALEAIGCDVIPLHEPVDLLVGFRGLNLLLEVKRLDVHKAKLRTPAQVKFHAQWRGQKAVVTSVEGALEAVRLACQPPRYGLLTRGVDSPKTGE